MQDSTLFFSTTAAKKCVSYCAASSSCLTQLEYKQCVFKTAAALITAVVIKTFGVLSNRMFSKHKHEEDVSACSNRSLVRVQFELSVTYI